MNAKMIFPPGFDKAANKKYPVFMECYGGPNSQKAAQVYHYDVMNRVAMSGVIALIVDGRGTGFKGRKFRSAVSKRLGHFEALDQIAAARWAGQQPYVDASRIGIWGWSFGGFLTSKVIEADSGVFALGVAVAPVTDWKFYDTCYTERYMKTPEENFQGYLESAVTRMQGFKNTKFLLMHGTADDNVHFQNSAELVWHLTGAGVMNYTVQYFTDSDHSISENGARTVVYDRIFQFLCRENFISSSCS
jgi:dipeptidyl aminopeptidase/acylaminoacyl peptidase